MMENLHWQVAKRGQLTTVLQDSRLVTLDGMDLERAMKRVEGLDRIKKRRWIHEACLVLAGALAGAAVSALSDRPVDWTQAAILGLSAGLAFFLSRFREKDALDKALEVGDDLAYALKRCRPAEPGPPVSP